MSFRYAIAIVLAGLAASCGPDTGAQDDAGADGGPVLGPVDGRDLPPTDLERVQVGDAAPDFSLVSLAGPVLTLSDFRDERNVVLVFYRGHW